MVDDLIWVAALEGPGVREPRIGIAQITSTVETPESTEQPMAQHVVRPRVGEFMRIVSATAGPDSLPRMWVEPARSWGPDLPPANLIVWELWHIRWLSIM